MDSHHILNTFVAASVLGIFLFLLANRIKVSAIVILLLGGILAGPEFLHLVEPDYLGDGLNTIISIAVGLILFEGGLTLDANGYRSVGKEIFGVLSKGVLVTWFGSALAIHLVFPQFHWMFAIFAASLIIVTGPTVIGPLLKRINVKKNLHHILHWEGVLIDPIGVFIALLCYEWILSAGKTGVIAGFGDPEVLYMFGTRIVVGILLGVVTGFAIYGVLVKNFVSDDHLNIFVLACAMANIAVADSLASESGLLSVTIAGFIVGYKDTPQLDKIIEYKVELKDYLIGLLFVLLAANLSLAKFTAYGFYLLILVLVIMFLIRPLNIFISTRKSSLTIKEKLFLSWIAPRGIVAASMASLFASKLEEIGLKDAAFIESFAYSVIAGTVIFQGFTAGWVGRMLGVLEQKPTGWLIVGAHGLARAIGRFLIDRGQSVVLLDTNPREVKLAKREGLPALCDNSISVVPDQHPEMYGVGNVLAITENEELNSLVCQRWQKVLGSKAKLYRWGTESINSSMHDASLLIGQAVWTRFHLRAVLAQAGVEDLETAVVPLKNKQKHSQILIHTHDDDFLPDSPLHEGLEGEALVLGHISETAIPTQVNWVVFSHDPTLHDLYYRLLARLENSFPKLKVDELLKELDERESEFTSMIGHGIALPHTYTETNNETVVMVARLDPAIPCQHTGSDIDLVFMILSPEDQPVEHLNQISKIAKFVMKEENRQAMLDAKNPSDLFKVIAKEG